MFGSSLPFSWYEMCWRRCGGGELSLGMVHFFLFASHSATSLSHSTMISSVGGRESDKSYNFTSSASDYDERVFACIYIHIYIYVCV